MTGFGVREKLVDLAIKILQDVAARSGNGVQVFPWDGEEELKRPWCDVSMPNFETYGSGSGAWECRLSIRLVTEKGGRVPKSEFSEYISALEKYLAMEAAQCEIGISEMDVEDVEAVVDTKGRVVACEFVFAAAI